MDDEFKEETRNYRTSPDYEWWEIHKRPITDIAAIVSVLAFGHGIVKSLFNLVRKR